MAWAAIFRGPTTAQRPNAGIKKQYRNDKHEIESYITNGEKAYDYLLQLFGPERGEDYVATVRLRLETSQSRAAADPMIVDLDGAEDANAQDELSDGASKLPRGFWQKFCAEVLNCQYTTKKRIACWRALKFYIQCKVEGATTLTAMRGMRKSHSCRDHGGAMNARKSPGLGFELLQFFVDEVQRLRCRADTCLMLKKAKELRQHLLLVVKIEVRKVPKLEGNAGHVWFWRWRKMYGIAKRVVGMKLKVAWAKVRKRVLCFLSNLFRLQAFWEICHPGTPMRFISIDQKPSWFNNAGHTGTFAKKGGSQPSVRENFAATRQRYSILTSVPSWGHGDFDNPPKVAVLFKNAPNGSVINRLRSSDRMKPWMMVQAQENGSYRSGDMVQALEWMLPKANKSEESIIVMLDWFTGHTTEEVAAKVREKGHILIFHGGGCTPFTQVNDTHLHATLARYLVQIENDWAWESRRLSAQQGRTETPKLSREDILSIVQTAWLAIDHETVASKGYKQTGPTMPLRGKVYAEDVFEDLLRVMNDLEEPTDPLEVGMSFRDAAVQFVQEGATEGKWSTWQDAYKLIEEHDQDLGEALDEGLEAFSADPYDDEKEPDADDDADDVDDNGGGGDEDAHDDDDAGGGGDDDADGDGLPAKDSEAEDEEEDEDPAADNDGDDGDDHGPGGGSGRVVHFDSAAAVDEDPFGTRMAAMLTLYHDAKKFGNDRMVRMMRKEMQELKKHKRESATPCGMALRKRALEQQAEESKKRKVAAEEERLSAKTAEEAKARKAEADAIRAKALQATQEQILINRRDMDERNKMKALQRANDKWLQTVYPALLARKCINFYKGLSTPARRGWCRHVDGLLSSRIFSRQLFIQDLWKADKAFTQEFCMVKPFTLGQQRQVRCGLQFQELIDKEAPKDIIDGRDPVVLLERLWAKCIPYATKIFTDNNRPLRILHLNDYIIEKAFVYGIICLSKWIGPEHFGQGVHGLWPPDLPNEILPMSVYEDDREALSHGAASSSGCG